MEFCSGYFGLCLRSMLSLLVLVGCGASSSLAARAGSIPPLPLSEGVRRADDFYLGRQNSQNVREGLQVLRERVAQNPSDYEAWWRISKFNCYLARQAAKPQKLKLLDEAVDAGKRAVTLAPNRVEGHFWLGANMGLTAEERGFVKALMLVDTIRQEMETVVRIDPDYEQAAGMRTLGRLDFRTPFFKGGSKRRSVELLENCLQRYPENSLTMLYLADSYMSVGLRDKARKQLENILSLCPDPLYTPELAENQAQARTMLAKFFPGHK